MSGSTGPGLPPSARLPRAPTPSALRLAIGTVLGVGRLPLGPGTWASLVTVLVAAALFGVEGPGGESWSGLGSAFGLGGSADVGSGPTAAAAGDPLSSAALHSVPIGALHPIPIGALHLGFAVTLGALLLLGCGVGARALTDYGLHDPGAFVLDEVVGQGLALWPLVLEAARQQRALPWTWLLLAFVAFRFFDIVKPPPVRQAERLPGGVGIMADDVVAGLFAMVVVWLVIAP